MLAHTQRGSALTTRGDAAEKVLGPGARWGVDVPVQDRGDLRVALGVIIAGHCALYSAPLWTRTPV